MKLLVSILLLLSLAGCECNHPTDKPSYRDISDYPEYCYKRFLYVRYDRSLTPVFNYETGRPQTCP